MYREAEKQFRSALKQQDFVDIFLYLCKVYTRLDQPLTAVEIFKQGLEKFPGETSLLSGIARIYEVCIIKFKFHQNRQCHRKYPLSLLNLKINFEKDVICMIFFFLCNVCVFFIFLITFKILLIINKVT